MAEIRLTIQHDNMLYEPPIEEGIQIEWERTGSPGKLSFTTPKILEEDVVFGEGDQVCFYYDGKLVFVGYIFTKKRDREHRVQITCYDQIRYLKNKYTYVFENKTASQIVKALCDDFNLKVGEFENTGYVLPAIAEENISALDIILDVLEETLVNTGNLFTFYDDGGKLQIKNCTNMMCPTVIMEDTAENFDYSSSIDSETYNNVVLYYKGDNNQMQLFTATSNDTISQWGLLRYFEEVKNPTIAQNKANILLKSYNRKTRELKITGAFGDISVRGGTMLPVRLNLGDITTNNFMRVEKVTHNFSHDFHTMDLTLEGAWEDKEYDIVSQSYTIGGGSGSGSESGSGSTTNTGGGGSTNQTGAGRHSEDEIYRSVLIDSMGSATYVGKININYIRNSESKQVSLTTGSINLKVDRGSKVSVNIVPKDGYSYQISSDSEWTPSGGGRDRSKLYVYKANANADLIVRWVR